MQAIKYRAKLYKINDARKLHKGPGQAHQKGDDDIETSGKIKKKLETQLLNLKNEAVRLHNKSEQDLKKIQNKAKSLLQDLKKYESEDTCSANIKSLLKLDSAEHYDPLWEATVHLEEAYECF